MPVVIHRIRKKSLLTLAPVLTVVPALHPLSSGVAQNRRLVRGNTIQIIRRLLAPHRIVCDTAHSQTARHQNSEIRNSECAYPFFSSMSWHARLARIRFRVIFVRVICWRIPPTNLSREIFSLLRILSLSLWACSRIFVSRPKPMFSVRVFCPKANTPSKQKKRAFTAHTFAHVDFNRLLATRSRLPY